MSATASARSGFVVECAPCRLFGRPAASEDEATQLAGIHDDIHHRGAPTAAVHPA